MKKDNIAGVPEMRPGKVYMAYESNMTYDMGRADMARVLGTAREFRTGVSNGVDYDRRGYAIPFHTNTAFGPFVKDCFSPEDFLESLGWSGLARA